MRDQQFSSGVRPAPLSQLSAATLADVDVVLTDIDDTLTLDGRLPAAAYDAIERLTRSGVHVIPVTGRPAGWCDLIARLWPVAGVVGENGAFYFYYDRHTRDMCRVFFEDEDKRQANRSRLEALTAQVFAALPGSALSADQGYRACDVAIDVCEDVNPPLDAAAVARVMQIFERGGAIAKLSSIHVNAWIGPYDKVGMTRRMLADRFGMDLERDSARIVYVGDSPNDAPMFEHVALSVGVANVAAFLDGMSSPPAYICDAPGGDGFTELVNLMLENR